MRSFIPRDSSWNIAVVAPLRMSSYVGRIVGGQALEIQHGAAGGAPLLVDRGQRPIDDGERAQAEKIELHEADRFDVVLVELRDRATRARLTIEGGELGKASRGDHDAPGVPSGVASQSFELSRQIDDRP